MMHNAKSILKSVFGYESFYPMQEEIILSVLNKIDTLVLMPTGGGKSICYQIPALIFKNLTIVVSPLISLMKDQVDQLKELGINAVLLNSTLTPEQYNANKKLIMSGNVKLLYLAPETLMKTDILNFLKGNSPQCFAIDEAHCISHWGHDFRPEYRQLKKIKSIFPDSVIIALTATAIKRVREDIKTNLCFNNPKEFIASFNRPNLFLEVIPKNNSFSQVLNFLNKFTNQSGIIYCLTRRQVDELSEKLYKKGFSVKPYHAGLSDEERRVNQELFIKDDIQIIVATIAFGMGINKPNVRFILHHDLPKNIESYYQEIGRAGRDGLNSHCLLLYNYGDSIKINYFLDQKENEEEKRIAKKHLHDMIKFAESQVCRRKLIVSYFGENYTKEKCDACDNCINSKKYEVDISEISILILNTILQTAQRFGKNHIINILKGSNEKKVLQYNHDKLSTYDMGKEYSKTQLDNIIIQLIKLGIIKKDLDNFGIIKLTYKAKDVLNRTLKVFGDIKIEEKEFDNYKNELPEYNKSLFELLRIKRKELSDKYNFPPYFIFHDSTLIQMSQFFPRNKLQLAKINGVGEIKIEKYGDEFLNIILDYISKNPNIKVINHPQFIYKEKKEKTFKPKHIITSDLYNNGESVEQIAYKFGVKINTILDHFYKYLMDGNNLRTDGILILSNLKDSQKIDLEESFNKNGTFSLKCIFDEFNGKISYDEIKINRIYYLAKKMMLKN